MSNNSPGNHSSEATTHSSKKVIQKSALKKSQQFHAFLITLLPLLGTIIAVSLLGKYRISITEISLFLTMWIASGTGITVGFHRLFTHRSFKTSKVIQVILVILGSMAGQGPLIYWVALHRRHHECSDQLGDPHSPHQQEASNLKIFRGLAYAHILWMFDHEIPNPLYYAPELLRDKILFKVSQLYFVWFCLGLVFPTVIGGFIYQSFSGAFLGFLWGGLVRLFFVEHAIWSVNSIMHIYGERPFQTNERSTNNLWLAIPTLGESWHNNHHAFNSSAFFGMKWWQIDWGGYVIRTLEFLNLAWDVKKSTKQMIENRSAWVQSKSVIN
ncbi:acyl-CoA desaturase [Phormidium sp. FACHB-592]|uniref:Acyl-CoA desaturase n=1 Tax=Stenomitos frigidus AS-A4 TaxID=2933935 RepID=A0ABV0KRU3_9CYAN|nr:MULTISPECIES: acyl-CoA desaturase [Cyanophyceae]MBD2037724.1 acyl-CoA desaturase [Leptolyngbya sp. FACHB-321]MBD2074203.1 acyl-CoA desaturase [Phormidium sp. FACHB-592]